MGQAKEFDDVLREELSDIARRREQAGFEASAASKHPPDQDPVDVARKMQLVGLALSGGGVRSGAVSLGLLQSLYDQGLLNQIDYLSTVSGGGYAGTYLSGLLEHFPRNAAIDWRLPGANGSAATAQSAPTGAAPVSSAANGHTIAGRQAPPPQHLPLEFGTQPDGAQPPAIRRLIFSGILLRKLRELVSSTLFGVLVNWTMVLGGLTLAVTALAVAYRALDEPLAQDVVSAVTYPGDIPRAFFPSLVVLAVWLVVQMTRALSRRLRWAPRMIATSSLLALALVGSLLCGTVLIINTGDVSLARPSVAAEMDQQIDAMRDLQQWAWVVLLLSIAITVLPFFRRNDLLRSGTSSAKTWESWVARISSWGMLAGVPLVLFGLVVRENLFAANETRDEIGSLYPAQIRDWQSFAERIEREHAMIPLAPFHASQSLEPSGTIWRATASAGVAANLSAVIAAAKAEEVPHDGSVSSWEAVRILDERLRHLRRNHWLIERWVSSLANLFDGGGPVGDYFFTARARRQIQADIVASINDQLKRPDFCSMFPMSIANAELDGAGEKQRAAEWSTARRSAAQLARLAESQNQSGQPYADELVSANRKLLELWYAGEIYPPSTVFAQVVLHRDQITRTWIMVWSACAFFLIGLLVDVNLTSAHFYYRQRLAEVWNLTRADGRGIALGDMKNTDCGGPYHLINATVNLVGPRRNESSEPTELFLLSRRYCGSRRVQFESTESYGASGIISLADAMAISGAAVSPMAVLNSPMLFYALLLTNARLGQWVPNPGEHRTLQRYPTFIRAILSYFSSEPEKADYLYVSDGGHHDNTGIEALLERRCRVIIACDASCDPNHQFLDLLRLLRRMTLFSGITFAAADGTRLSLEALVPDLQTRLTRDHLIRIRVHYPGESEHGWLVYMKSSLTGDEPPNLLHYREEDKEFPHDPTSDLFYEPRRFECYRTLGYHLGERLKKHLNPKKAELAKLWLKDRQFDHVPSATGLDDRTLRTVMQLLLRDILDGKTASSRDLIERLKVISDNGEKVKGKAPASNAHASNAAANKRKNNSAGPKAAPKRKRR